MRKTRSAGAGAALAAGLLTVLLAAAMVPLSVAAHQNPVTTVTETLAVTLPFAAVGLIVAMRQPGNPIGWLMLCFALGFLLSIDAGSYDIADYQFGRGLPFGPASLLLYLLWEPARVLGPVAVLLFPDGRLPSARWRWALQAGRTFRRLHGQTQVSPGLCASSGQGDAPGRALPQLAGQLHDVGPDQQPASGRSRDALAEGPVIQVDAGREPVFLSGQVAGDNDAPGGGGCRARGCRGGDPACPRRAPRMRVRRYA